MPGPNPYHGEWARFDAPTIREGAAQATQSPAPEHPATNPPSSPSMFSSQFLHPNQPPHFHRSYPQLDQLPSEPYLREMYEIYGPPPRFLVPYNTPALTTRTINTPAPSGRSPHVPFQWLRSSRVPGQPGSIPAIGSADRSRMIPTSMTGGPLTPVDIHQWVERRLRDDASDGNLHLTLELGIMAIEPLVNASVPGAAEISLDLLTVHAVHYQVAHGIILPPPGVLLHPRTQPLITPQYDQQPRPGAGPQRSRHRVRPSQAEERMNAEWELYTTTLESFPSAASNDRPIYSATQTIYIGHSCQSL